MAMRMIRALGVGLGLVASITFGAAVDDAAAQEQDCGNGVAVDGDVQQTNCALISAISEANGGDGRDSSGDATGGDATGGDGGNGSRGGFEIIRDVGNAREDASSTVILGTVTTPDVVSPDVNVEASLLTDPVLVIAGSFHDTGVDVFAPDGSGSAQAGTTGGNGLTADASGGADGADGNARGGDADAGDGDGAGGPGGVSQQVLDTDITQSNTAEVGLRD